MLYKRLFILFMVISLPVYSTFPPVNWVTYDGTTTSEYPTTVRFPNDSIEDTSSGLVVSFTGGLGGSSGDAWSDAVDSDILPTGADNTYDLGSTAASFKDGYFEGTLEAGTLTEGGVDVINATEGGTWTGGHDFGGADDVEIPNGANPTVDTAGQTAVDTTTGQVVFFNTAVQVLNEVDYKTAYIENLAAADDNIEIFVTREACEIVSIGVHCIGTCTTPADISLEDRAGNAMAHPVPTASTSTSNTVFQHVYSSNALVSGEGLRFDVDNTPDPETDKYSVTFGVRYTRQ